MDSQLSLVYVFYRTYNDNFYFYIDILEEVPMRRTSANKMFKRKQILASLCVIFFIISATVIIALTIGKEAGDFVIRVQDDTMKESILLTNVDPILNPDYNPDPDNKNPETMKKYLYENKTGELTPPAAENFIDYSPRLFLRSQAGDYGFETIERYTTTKSEENPFGVKPNGTQFGSESGLYKHMDDTSCALYCYTFYVINTGASNIPVNIKMTYKDSNDKNGIGTIARFMTYTKDEAGAERAIIYYKQGYDKDNNIKEQNAFYPHFKGLTTAPFDDTNALDGRYVFNDEYVYLDVNNYVKYSVFFWLDGDDPDLQLDQSRFHNQTINFSLELSVGN